MHTPELRVNSTEGLNEIIQRPEIRIMLEKQVAEKGKGKQERHQGKKELQIDRKKDGMDLFSRL